jgi:hypothetical protein
MPSTARHSRGYLGFRARHMSAIIGELPCGPVESREAQIRSAYYMDSYYDSHEAKHRMPPEGDSE